MQLFYDPFVHYKNIYFNLVTSLLHEKGSRTVDSINYLAYSVNKDAENCITHRENYLLQYSLYAAEEIPLLHLDAYALFFQLQAIGVAIS